MPRSLFAFWMGGQAGIVVPVPIFTFAGVHLPDWGMRYLIDDMNEDVMRAREGAPEGERPPGLLPSWDWGQEIIRRRMWEDEEDI